MITEKYKRVIEEFLGQTITRVSLLADTFPSWLYRLDTNKSYVCKITKRQPLAYQYDNHKRIYQEWNCKQSSLCFRIPEPYLLGPDGQFVLMEYVEGVNLLRFLTTSRSDVSGLFEKVGLSLRQFHRLVAVFREDARDLQECKSIADVLVEPGGPEIAQRLNHVSPNQCGVIFRDFTPTNVLATTNEDLYFVDIPEVFYRGPYYYDLARFIDTTKVFGLTTKPWWFLRQPKCIQQAVEAFLKGFDPALDLGRLKEMQQVQRKEHVHYKTHETRVRGMILELLYKYL